MFRDLIRFGRRKKANKPRANPVFTKDVPALREYAIGEYTYGIPTVMSWGGPSRLKIGRYCSIADGVTIMLGGEHRTEWISTYPFGEMMRLEMPTVGHPWSRGDVLVGNDVWICQSVLIRSGVCIGDGAVLGAAAVVTKDVQPYAIVAGNPAKLVRMRFTGEVIAELLRIKWWDWPPDLVKEAVPLICSKDPTEFLKVAHQYARKLNRDL